MHILSNISDKKSDDTWPLISGSWGRGGCFVMLYCIRDVFWRYHS